MMGRRADDRHVSHRPRVMDAYSAGGGGKRWVWELLMEHRGDVFLGGRVLGKEKKGLWGLRGEGSLQVFF